MEEPEKLTLNLVMHSIKRERGCSRQHAYRLAKKVISEMDAMEQREIAVENRQEFMTRKRLRRPWQDFLQDQVVWEY